MSNRLLNDKRKQLFFEQHGYVVVDLLNEGDLSRLRSIHEESMSGQVSGFTSTNMINSKVWRKSLALAIYHVLKIPLNNVLSNCNFWLPAFLIKPPGEDTEFRLHQDWTFVDEKVYVSGNVWIPLCDTDENNGTLHFIEKSHHLCVSSFRVQGMPLFFEGSEDLLKQYCTEVQVKAGQAIVFFHSVIHYSPPNRSQLDRVAVSCGFHSTDAPLMFYHRSGESRIEEYLMPDNFVFDFDDSESLGCRPEHGQLNRTLDYEQRIYSEEDLVNLFQGRT